MPQLIAMIIIVVGAMIYMFQTFGGTGDKIEGIAQKTSVITEINNIKTGLKLAARAEQISATANVTITPETTTGGTTTPAVTTPARYLKALGLQKYFAEQINEQIEKRTATGIPTGYDGTSWSTNSYSAISFGGTTEKAGGMIISLVADKEGMVPGIFVDFNFADSSLKDSAGFLESQIANDLKDVAYIDRTAKTPKSGDLDRSTTTDTSSIAKRTPKDLGGGTESDGQFIIYFKDFGSNEIVIK